MRHSRQIRFAGLETPALLLLRARRPDAREAIGLQFGPDAERVRSRIAAALALRIHFRENAQQILHVVADFVRDHIGVRELAGCAQTPRHHIKES